MFNLQFDEDALRHMIRDAVASAVPATGDTSPAYLTVRQAAEYLGCSEGTVRNWITAGEVPAYQWGRIVRLKRHELDAKLAPTITPAKAR